MYEFVTSEGKIILTGEKLQYKRLKKTDYGKWIFYLWAVVFFISSAIERYQEALEEGKPAKWLGLALYSIILLLLLSMAFEIIFRRYWKNKIDLHRIREVRLEPAETELETRVVLKLQSGRYRVFHFRILENQAEDFVQKISASHPAVKVVREESSQL